MKPARLTALIVILLATGFQAHAQFTITAPITLETNLDARASFEALGKQAGLNVIFPRLFPPVTTSVPFKVDNKSVTEALDLLAKQTTSFWTRWDDETVLVFPDTQQYHRDFDRQFLRRIAVDRPPEQVLQELLTTQIIRGVVGTGNSIVLRDIEARIKLAEGTLGKTGVPIGGADLEDLYLTEVSRFRTPASVHSQLNIKAPGPVSLNVAETQRATFETLGRMAGLNVLFPRTYPNRTHSFRIDNVDYFAALDLLALQTGSFWQPMNETTIAVFEDTQQNRRDFGTVMVETIYLPAGTSTQELNTIVSGLRSLLSLRGVHQNEAAKAILIKDTPTNLIVVESLVAAIAGASAPLRKEAASTLLDRFSETADGRTPASESSKLQMKSAGRISLRMEATISEVFTNLAAMAGLDLLFSGPSRNVSFNVQGLDIVDALDLLALQSGFFWQALDNRTIQVREDTQQSRRDYQNHVVKTIYLPAATSSDELNGIGNVLRTALTFRGIFLYYPARAILIRDTATRVALAEKVIGQLNTHPAPITSEVMSARGITETTVRAMAPVARSELRTSSSGPVSINLNQDARASYEALAQIAGLRVLFDPRAVAGGAVPFRLTGVDVLDAFDYLALQTRTFWKVVDDRTILVAPDTTQVHAELDPRVSKIFYLNTKGLNATNGIINVLKTALSVREITGLGPEAIAVSETPQRMALVEEIIASLDKARP